MNAIRPSVRNLQVSWPSCASTDHYGVVLRLQLFGIDVNTHVGVRDKGLDNNEMEIFIC